jgi:hypothetical protein
VTRNLLAVLVELKARFDEARNVGYATRLEEAGCNVAYGIVGLKTHAKCVLVVRREKSAAYGLRTYVHIGTGNYNPSTAALYTDLGLLSCDQQLGEDVVDLFKFLTGIHLQKAVGGFRKLLVGNQYMKAQLLSLIDSEIDSAKRGYPAAVCIKVRRVSCCSHFRAKMSFSYSFFCRCGRSRLDWMGPLGHLCFNQLRLGEREPTCTSDQNLKCMLSFLAFTAIPRHSLACSERSSLGCDTFGLFPLMVFCLEVFPRGRNEFHAVIFAISGKHM